MAKSKRGPRSPQRFVQVRQRMSKVAGYYSTMFRVWKGTNARRRGLRGGSYERMIRISK